MAEETLAVTTSATNPDHYKQPPKQQNQKSRDRRSMASMEVIDVAEKFNLDMHLFNVIKSVSYTHLTLPTYSLCRSRWSPYH